jgi:hypothetical protein
VRFEILVKRLERMRDASQVCDCVFLCMCSMPLLLFTFFLGILFLPLLFLSLIVLCVFGYPFRTRTRMLFVRVCVFRNPLE